MNTDNLLHRVTIWDYKNLDGTNLEFLIGLERLHKQVINREMPIYLNQNAINKWENAGYFIKKEPNINKELLEKKSNKGNK